jgi:hypothetical protein
MLVSWSDDVAQARIAGKPLLELQGRRQNLAELARGGQA